MSELLNLVGLSTGVVLYAALLAMVVRAGRTSTRTRLDPLLLVTSVLGLVWNLSGLAVYELPKVGVVGSFPWLSSLGLAALGFLPAVVVQSVLRGKRDSVRGWPGRAVALTAYAASAIAAGLHVTSAWTGDSFASTVGMRLLTYTFIGLVVPLAALTRRQPGARRALWAAALSIFAVSAMHLSQLHRGDASWPVELLGHHASLPLAFAILYQDFPFALADLFLKRALTLVALVGAAILGATAIAAIHAPDPPLRDPRDVGVLVTLWVATALLYPRLRDVIGWFVDSVLLDRPDYVQLALSIARHSQQHQDIGKLLDEACSQLAPALSARVVRWYDTAAAAETIRPASADRTEVAAIVDVPVAEPPRFSIEVAQLTGGRRLLSDDRVALETIATLLGRRIDGIRLAHERYTREIREQEIGKLATEAELRALRAQINPHFLFNALTTIGYLIQTAPPRALDTLLRLTSLLRSVLRSEGELTTLGREIELVESYLDIEHARFEHRLRVAIDVPAPLRSVRIMPLLVQPLVENAVKHGIAPKRRGGEVTVTASLDFGVDLVAMLVIVVRDTGAGASTDTLRRGRESGVGLNNVARRLACQYGSAASLSLSSTPGAGTTVEIRVPAKEMAAVELRASRNAS
jgi:two-component system LytT family sensor kinase